LLCFKTVYTTNYLYVYNDTISCVEVGVGLECVLRSIRAV
jgi:hypothetical protein